MLSEIADAADTVLAPAIRAGTGVLVREIIPRIAVGAVIFPHCPPGALAQIRAPKVPDSARSFILGEALLLGIHQFGERSPRRPGFGVTPKRSSSGRVSRSRERISRKFANPRRIRQHARGARHPERRHATTT